MLQCLVFFSVLAFSAAFPGEPMTNAEMNEICCFSLACPKCTHEGLTLGLTLTRPNAAEEMKQYQFRKVEVPPNGATTISIQMSPETALPKFAENHVKFCLAAKIDGLDLGENKDFHAMIPKNESNEFFGNVPEDHFEILDGTEENCVENSKSAEWNLKLTVNHTAIGHSYMIRPMIHYFGDTGQMFHLTRRDGDAGKDQPMYQLSQEAADYDAETPFRLNYPRMEEDLRKKPDGGLKRRAYIMVFKKEEEPPSFDPTALDLCGHLDSPELERCMIN